MQVLDCDSRVGAGKRLLFLVSRCFLYVKNREEAREPVLVLCIALRTQLKPWLIFLFRCTFALVYSAVLLIFIVSALPAFWAVICVHNKLVQDKEFKLRVGLTFALVLSIIQQRPEEGWPLVILSRIKQGLHTKLRLYCIDLQVLYWFILHLSVHTSPCLHVKGGSCISLLSKCVNFALTCMWSCPPALALRRKPRSPNCSVKSHSSFHSYWMRLWMPGFMSKPVLQFFCAQLPFEPISYNSPCFLPSSRISASKRWGTLFIIWNSNMTGCLRLFKT